MMQILMHSFVVINLLIEETMQTICISLIKLQHFVFHVTLILLQNASM